MLLVGTGHNCHGDTLRGQHYRQVDGGILGTATSHELTWRPSGNSDEICAHLPGCSIVQFAAWCNFWWGLHPKEAHVDFHSVFSARTVPGLRTNIHPPDMPSVPFNHQAASRPKPEPPPPPPLPPGGKGLKKNLSQAIRGGQVRAGQYRVSRIPRGQNAKRHWHALKFLLPGLSLGAIDFIPLCGKVCGLGTVISVVEA